MLMMLGRGLMLMMLGGPDVRGPTADAHEMLGRGRA